MELHPRAAIVHKARVANRWWHQELWALFLSRDTIQREGQKEYFDQMEEPRMLRDTQVSTVGPHPCDPVFPGRSPQLSTK